MKILLATPADAPAIANILTGWNAATPWMPRVHSRRSEKGFARLLVDRGWTIVAQDRGRVVGFLSRDGDEVHALYLIPAARGQGIGKALLDDAKAAVPRLSLYTFQANAGACRFYRREGFTEAFRTDGAGNDEHLPDIRFCWRAA
ncbi:GNAT family N-acetyltransferase [Aliiroseovarius sp. S2029]|uniref:GNAT family N-acetyltransferase n=1 Tax=Aliiroseovarius sp. S2029 TaxID=2936988 RepID=UPI0020BE6C51|nr:GNAT family N-acetyltransferase [Aliiroseovarius sp. S2029]MCK8483205.1 GNAT family N-acetyltransferase [Aliiroseovarius sp. S2029]